MFEDFELNVRFLQEEKKTLADSSVCLLTGFLKTINLHTNDEFYLGLAQWIAVIELDTICMSVRELTTRCNLGNAWYATPCVWN